MNPTGEWNEYSRLVISTLERLENDVKELKYLRVVDQQEVHNLFLRIRDDALAELEQLRSSNHDKEVERLKEELESARRALLEARSTPETEEIIRDHKVDSFFAHRSKVQWAIIAGAIGLGWSLIEFVAKPLIQAALGLGD